MRPQTKKILRSLTTGDCPCRSRFFAKWCLMLAVTALLAHSGISLAAEVGATRDDTAAVHDWPMYRYDVHRSASTPHQLDRSAASALGAAVASAAACLALAAGRFRETGVRCLVPARGGRRPDVCRFDDHRQPDGVRPGFGRNALAVLDGRPGAAGAGGLAGTGLRGSDDGCLHCVDAATASGSGGSAPRRTTAWCWATGG
jgi:hypothetical protein